MKNLLRDVGREDLVALSSFLQANGITENAASISPLLTGDLSFTTGSASSPMLDNIRFAIALFKYGVYKNIGKINYRRTFEKSSELKLFVHWDF